MKNSFKGASQLLRRDGSAVRSTALLDRSINPLSAFDSEENAMRVALGHMCFGVDIDQRGKHLHRLYLIPEIAQHAYGDLSRLMSVNIQSMSSDDFDTIYETANCDASFTTLSWENGIDKLRQEVDANPELANKNTIRALFAIDRYPIDQIDPEVALRRIGEPSGFRFEASL